MYSQYGNIKQKWIVVASEEMRMREIQTYDKNLARRFKASLKELKQISLISFACEADAKNALCRYLMDNPLVSLIQSEIKIIHKRAIGKRGRPKEGEPLITNYLINATVEPNPTII